MIGVPPKWLREKMTRKEPLTEQESEWLHKKVLLGKTKEELVSMVISQEKTIFKLTYGTSL